MSTGPRVCVIIPHRDRLAQLKRAVTLWEGHDPAIQVEIVDMGSEELTFPVGRVNVHYCPSLWNPSRARNIGARRAGRSVDAVLFSTADATITPDFYPWLKGAWGTADAWFPLHRVLNLPGDPQRDGVLLVKPWVHWLVRGFQEGMFERCHGWGGECEDYIERVRMGLAAVGGSIQYYPSEMVTFLSHGDDLRVRHFTEKDMRVSSLRHREYAESYRLKAGYEGNLGQEWGVWPSDTA